MRTISLALLTAALTACAGPQRAASTTAAEASAAKLDFIEDDYPRALVEARARGVPIFVDSWAPW